MPFEISGMEAEIARFEKIAKDAEERAKRAVRKGATFLADCLKGEVAVLDGHVQGGIRADPVKYDAANGYYSDVGPKGNDPETGEPLAKIGNILEYGRSNMRPQPWFEVTVRREEGMVLDIMDGEFNEGV